MALQSSLPHDPRARCPEVPLATLNVIVRQAIAATGASGSAVALSDGHAIVFQASCGDPAPAIGVPLNPSARFSGECIRTGEVLRCDDAELDPRVDGPLCGQLGIRSMLVVPVKAGISLVGVLQVFSREPYAFNVFHEATLERMAEMIIRASGETWIRSAVSNRAAATGNETSAHRHNARERGLTAASAEATNANGGSRRESAQTGVTIELPGSYVESVAVAGKSRRSSRSANRHREPSVHRDREWKVRLRKAEAAILQKPVMSAVMVSSLILVVGFLVTLATRNESWPSASPQVSRQISTKPAPASSEGIAPAAQPPAQASTQTTASNEAPATSNSVSADAAAGVVSDGSAPKEDAAVAQPADSAAKSKVSNESKSSANKGHADPKHKKPHKAAAPPEAGPSLATVSAIPSVNGGSTLMASLGTGSVAPVSTPVAASSELVPPKLVQEVKPQYPAVARSSGVQGAVILEAIISKEGKVRAVKAVSGNALLTAAAMNAVRNWRYSPSLLQGQPVESTIRVTVNFTFAN